MITILLSLVAAQAVDGTSTVQGFGNDTCAKWTINHSKQIFFDSVEDTWLAGFVSAYNFYEAPDGDIVKQIGFPKMIKVMSDYCRYHPNERVAEAAITVIAELNLQKTVDALNLQP